MKQINLREHFIIPFVLFIASINIHSATLQPKFPFKADFVTKVAGYLWGNNPGIALNITNADDKAYDSLEVRFYFNGTQEEMSISGDENDTICSFGAHTEIAVLFNADGYQNSRSHTSELFADTKIKRIADSYDSKSKKYCWYLPLKLTSVQLKPMQRLRIDLGWCEINPFPPYTELLDQPPEHLPDSQDWSWGPKLRSENSLAAFEGVKYIPKDSLDSPYFFSLQTNYYVAIFRNDSLLWGFPPDWKNYYGDSFDTIPRIVSTPDPMPYDLIRVPFDEYEDQLIRDSANLKISPFRINQAGYRPDDKKYFYYVGSSAPLYKIINTDDSSTAATGTGVSSGSKASMSLKITGCTDAMLESGGTTRYILESPVYSGSIFEGIIPDLPEGKYKIVSGSAESAPFVIRHDVYNMVKDALLKFYGVNRCGDSKSWFHPPCHLQDPVTGGWHDCGDHLKEGAAMSYTAAVLGLAAAVFKDLDQDIYDADQSITHKTDGIPDILYEAKHGADYILRSYDLANGKPADMITSVGDFSKDHVWWGRPEDQDNMPVTRGGPPREARKEPTTDYLGKYAANLAFVSKMIRPYDPAYADRCLNASKAIYEFTLPRMDMTNTPAYSGVTDVSPDAAFACLALLWATGEQEYLDDLCYDKSIGTRGQNNPKLFQGGLFTSHDQVFYHGAANTGLTSSQAHVLWGFFRLVLDDTSFCQKLGLSENDRLSLIEKTIFNLMANLSSVALGQQSIQLPENGIWIPPVIKYELPWFTMHTQMEWSWNNFQAGNITEMFYYYDIASRIQGIELPNTPASTDWKADEVKTVLIRMMDYMLGVNPLDISMIYGVGNKNFNHPLHRASNPELKNVPGRDYSYHHLVGALASGFSPSIDSFAEHANDYHSSEVGISATTNILMPVCGLSIVDRQVAADKKHAPVTQRQIFSVALTSVNGRISLKASCPIAGVDIVSLSGRLIFRQDLSHSPETSLAISTRGAQTLGRGIFLVRVRSVDGMLAVKRVASVQ